ncbi:MAG TPA: Rpn family recombination-promoting nuclease/putative transposase [Allocoleopsis sp.]
MRFISPKIDYAFKKIFGSDQSQDILRSFLNAIIYNGEEVIESLTIINPYNPGQIQSLKDSYLDVKAVLKNGSMVVIEMQLATMTAFNKRIAYNLAKAYSNQLVTGEDYPLLNPAIAVTITDFILFKETNQVINKFVFQEQTQKFEILNEELKLIFVELPKFKKSIEQLESLSDRWIYFIKETSHLQEIPENLGQVSEIKFALNLANQANMTVEELEVVDKRGMMLQDERGKLTYAEEKGEEKGRIKEAIALIKRLLKKRFGEISATTNSKIENLSLENLEQLGDDLLDFDSMENLENWLQER